MCIILVNCWNGKSEENQFLKFFFWLKIRTCFSGKDFNHLFTLALLAGFVKCTVPCVVGNKCCAPKCCFRNVYNGKYSDSKQILVLPKPNLAVVGRCSRRTRGYCKFSLVLELGWNECHVKQRDSDTIWVALMNCWFWYPVIWAVRQ